MSILAYPKHNFVIEFTNGQATPINDFTVSSSGYLKHICLKMINRNYTSQNGRACLLVLANESGELVSQSEFINYADIGRAENSEDYWHTKVRFDFPETGLTVGGYYLLAVYQESYEGTLDSFIGYCLDYNFQINQSSLANHPFHNARLAAEIYLLKDYYDFD